MSLLYSTDRPDFLERLGKLVGGTTFRQPSGGRGTRMEQLPDAHAIATALSFARRGPEDIGPDVAYCWALGSDAYRAKVTRVLANVLCRSSSLSREHAALAVGAGWEAMIHNKATARKRPSNIDTKAWDALLLLACGTLHNSAWDALAVAERCYHKAA